MKYYDIFICFFLLVGLGAGCNTTAGQDPAPALTATTPPVTSRPPAATITPAAQLPAALAATLPANNPDHLAIPTTVPAVGEPVTAADTPQAASPTAPPTIPPTQGVDDWKKLPVVPEISDTVKDIYLIGQTMGNNPRAFSKIGDCGSTPAWFLGDFDRGPAYYRLGEYEALQGVIDYFSGSFDRTSLAARSGFNASALWVPLWADRTYCNSSEAPLVCEYRIQRPALAFIMLGTNDVWKPEEFEPQMRKIIEYSIGNGIIPVLSTKADNQEKDHRINITTARLAAEYNIPLWNYWSAVNDLPNGGLQEDGAHLTWGRNFFDDPVAMSKAWPVRNLTALQMLNAVWEKIRQ